MLSLRTLSVLTVAAFSLAACGSPGDAPTTTSAPQFLEPSRTASAVPTPDPAGTPEKAPAGTVTSSATPKKTPSKAPATAPAGLKYAFPVKASNVAFHPTHSKYPATDIFADCGETVVATTSGVVLEVSRKDQYVKGAPDGPLNGGLSVSILGDDGVRYYGSHMSAIDPKITPGAHVTTGQTLGKIGRSGDTTACHLHFGISPPCSKVGDWWIQRGVLYPWPYLDAWRKGTAKSAVAAVAAWKAQHGCPAKPLVDP